MTLRCSAQNQSACSGGADAFLYLGSDIDVSLLRFMEPWETSAYFWDDMEAHSEYSYSAFSSDHEQDPRPSYRETTAPLRPLNTSDSTAVARFSSLVQRRLAETGPFSAVQPHPSDPLAWHFTFEGVRRSLNFIVEPINAHSLRLGIFGRSRGSSSGGRSGSHGYRGRVSTLALVGFSLPFRVPYRLRQMMNALLPDGAASCATARGEAVPWRLLSAPPCGQPAEERGMLEGGQFDVCEEKREDSSKSGGFGGMPRLAGTGCIVALCVSPAASVPCSSSATRPKVREIVEL